MNAKTIITDLYGRWEGWKAGSREKILFRSVKYASIHFSFLPLLFVIGFSSSPGIKPPMIKADELVKRFSNGGDTTYVIGFWATWCGPCLNELPAFEKLNEVYKDQKVKVLLVSMDFIADYEKKLVRFVKRKKLKSEVMLLNETKPNEFIDKINPKWNGSIPATMIVNSEEKYKEFFERELTYEFLEGKVKALSH